MKKLLGFIVVVAALLLGSYFGMGLLTERAIKKNIDVLNQTSGVDITLKSYHRGLFRSHAVLDWKLNLNKPQAVTPQDTLTISMPLQIDHGPIMTSNGHFLFGLGHAESNVALPIRLSKQLPVKFTSNSTTPIIHLSVFVSYFNQTTIQITVPQFHLMASQGHTQVESKGMTLHMHISATRKQIQGEWQIDNLNWVKDQIQIDLGGLQSNYDINLSYKGLSTGKATVLIPSVSVAQSGKKVLEIQHMDLYSDNKIIKGLFDSSLQAKIKELTLNHKTFSSCQVALNINHLDADTLSEINRKLSKIDQNPHSAQQQILFSILGDLPNLVNKGAEFKLSNFSIITADGPIISSAHFVFPNKSITNPLQLAEQITGSGNISISKPALKTLIKNSLQAKINKNEASTNPVVASDSSQPILPPQNDSLATSENMPAVNHEAANSESLLMTEVEQKINALLLAGVIVENKDSYNMAFDLTGGTLKINGKSFSPTMLQI